MSEKKIWLSKICEQCGKQFSYEKRGKTANENRKLCSLSCVNKHNAERHEKKREKRNCLFCGTQFDVKAKKDKQFCKQSCYFEFKKANRKLQPKKKCEFCKSEFVPPDGYASKHQRFCSNSCGRKADAALRKERGLPGPASGFRHSDESKLKISINNKSWLRKKEIVYRICTQCGTKFQLSHNGSDPERKFCSKSCATKARPNGEEHPNWKGGKHINNGYVNIRVDGEYVLEHRHVMSQIIGRDLYDHENVHHKNGIRSDNRPENLELWIISQTPGQRISDVVEWAKEIIQKYEHLLKE